MEGEREEVALSVSALHLTWEPGYEAAARAAAKVLELPEQALSSGVGPTLHFGALMTDMPAASQVGEEGHLLCVERAAGEPVVRCLARTPRGAFYGLRALRAAWTGEARLSLPLGLKAVQPAFTHRGIAEAVPVGWSWETRRQLLLFAGRHQLDHYLYAPGDDAYRTTRWRELYPREEAARLTDLISWARELFVCILYALQPQLDPTSSSDVAALEAKCHWLLEAGIEGIALLCEAGKWAPEAWAHFANQLLIRLKVGAVREPPLLWVGLSSLNSDGNLLYELARALDEEVEILWTGPELLNSRLLVETVAAFSNYLGRTPWLWENYPDNRFAPQKLFLGPYQGREAALAKHLHGE